MRAEPCVRGAWLPPVSAGRAQARRSAGAGGSGAALGWPLSPSRGAMQQGQSSPCVGSSSATCACVLPCSSGSESCPPGSPCSLRGEMRPCILGESSLGESSLGESTGMLFRKHRASKVGGSTN